MGPVVAVGTVFGGKQASGGGRWSVKDGARRSGEDLGLRCGLDYQRVSAHVPGLPVVLTIDTAVKKEGLTWHSRWK
jgi:hypothetical protein